MSVANFIPTIWSARLLAHLDKKHVYAALVNRDYEGEIKNFGDTVKINQIGDITINDYEKGKDIADPEDLSGDQTIITIDQAKYFNFAIDDVDKAQVNPKLMDAAMQRAAYSMNDVTDKFLANLMYLAAVNNNGTNLGSDDSAVVPTKNDAYDYLVDLGTDLTEKDVPTEGRWVVVPAWYHGLLLKDSRFVGNGTDYNKALIEGGEVGVAAGFRVWLSNNVPNVSGGKYKIVAGTNAGASYAEQILETKAYTPEKRFADAVKGLHVYGGKVVQPKCLSVLTASKN
nr:P22 phage major capsid protein family protein [uncultured Lachnoclostridium sp.]